jgi:6-phosphogluconate dehydrogenase
MASGGYPGATPTADVGVVGLAVMGSNLVLNILDKGFNVAVYNRTTAVTEKFKADNSSYGDKLVAGKSMEEFVAALKKPRKVLILVKAGGPTDAVIKQLEGVLEKDDIIVDTGNAHFKDQAKRAADLEAKGLRFLGMGISGGEEGARKGPAFFPGGTLSIWDEIKEIIEAASAKAPQDGLPCVTMCGSGGGGSCVKMYHNAGEYAILQIWAEAYAAMKGAGLTNMEVHAALSEWKARGTLSSYMLDITIEVSQHKDESGDGSFLTEKVADMIGSKGTGLWSVQEALGVGCPVPSLCEAVVCRQMSMMKDMRLQMEKRIGCAPSKANVDPAQKKDFLENLYQATYMSILCSYAQMFHCLEVLDKEHDMDIRPRIPKIIATFRAGCILAGTLLGPMTDAFRADPDLPNLLIAFKDDILKGAPMFRKALSQMLEFNCEHCPVMTASFGYLMTMNSRVVMSAQMVALQRDVFGRHGFKKLQADGNPTEESFNAQWNEMQ